MAKRPPPWRWLAYAIGFKLPDRYDEWVFHDLNDRFWQLREIGRVMVLALPFIVAVMFVPGSLGLRLSTAMILVVGPLYVSASFVDEFRNYRLRQHGLLPHPVRIRIDATRKRPELTAQATRRQVVWTRRSQWHIPST